MPGKILITGANGMLGTDLVPVLRAKGHEVVALGRDRLDVTNAPQARAVIDAEQPKVVIHCAAYTNVDGAEADPDAAYALNRDGAKHVAEACRDAGAYMCYISTDYVFDGSATRPWLPDDPTRPLGVYGKSKLAGEQAVAGTLAQHWIVRTSWLYGRGGKNFVDTMRKLAREKDELAVVDDQRGSPTWTVDLAEGLGNLVMTVAFGTYHLTGGGDTTWCGLTRKIVELEGLPTRVKPITTAELGRPAPRPAYSVLDHEMLKIANIAPLPKWEDSLARYLALMPDPVRATGA